MCALGYRISVVQKCLSAGRMLREDCTMQKTLRRSERRHWKAVSLSAKQGNTSAAQCRGGRDEKMKIRMISISVKFHTHKTKVKKLNM
jgi:hypothetical protein